MLGYAAKRVLVSIPVIFGILVVTFALARLIPTAAAAARTEPVQ